MKYFALTTSLDDDSLGRFIDFFNQNKTEPCTIVIHCAGGGTYQQLAMSRMISQIEDCTLFLSAAYSSAFYLAYTAKCKKILSYTSKGMWHLGRADVSLSIANKPYYHEDVVVIKNFEGEKRLSHSFAKKVMTAAEYKKYLDGQDIYFDFKRMKQIFPDAEVMK